MKIDNCKVSLKCDVDGCSHRATKKICYYTDYAQFYLCDRCMEKLRVLLNEQKKKEDEGVAGKNEEENKRK